jgi:hypothetical protein
MKKTGEGCVVEKREGLTDLRGETVYKHRIKETV